MHASAPHRLGWRHLRAGAVVLLLLTSGGVFAAEQTVAEYMAQKNPENLEGGAGAGGIDYYIKYYRPEFFDTLLQGTSDGIEGMRSGGYPLYALRAIAGHEPQLSFEVMQALVQNAEAEALKNPHFVNALSGYYGLMAWAGTSESLEFLKQRASFEYWKTHALPTSDLAPSGSDQKLAFTAQSWALGAIASHPSPTALAFLEACKADPRYANDQYLQSALTVGMASRRDDLAKYQHRDEMWAERGALPEMSHDALAQSRAQSLKLLRADPTTVKRAESNPYPDIKSASPAFPLVAKIGIPILVVSILWWLRIEWKKR